MNYQLATDGLGKRIWKVISKVINDCFTSANGDYDPARVAGYGIVVLGGLVYIGLEIFVVVTTRQFNEINFATGLAGIGAALIAAAGGVWIKKSTEIPLKEDPPQPPSQ